MAAPSLTDNRRRRRHWQTFIRLVLRVKIVPFDLWSSLLSCRSQHTSTKQSENRLDLLGNVQLFSRSIVSQSSNKSTTSTSTTKTHNQQEIKIVKKNAVDSTNLIGRRALVVRSERFGRQYRSRVRFIFLIRSSRRAACQVDGFPHSFPSSSVVDHH